MMINGLQITIAGDKKKPPVIFLHGFPFDSSMWENTLNSLNGNYYLVAPDLRGFGKSDIGDGHFTMDTFVDDLFMLQDELSIPKAVVVGFSMGGYIALRAYERNKDRFAGMVLVDTKASADADETKIRRGLGIKTINELGIETYMKEFIRGLFTQDAPNRIGKTYDSYYEKMIRQNPVAVKAALLAMAARTSTENLLPTINVPTLIVVGKEDKLSTPCTMEEMHGIIRNSEFHIIDNAAHMVPVENPEAFNEKLSGFLSKFF